MRRTIAMLSAVIRKEVRQTLRDKRMMALLILVPIIQLIIFGHAVNLDVDKVPTVIVDQDQSSTSRAHVMRLLADGTLREVGATSADVAERMLEHGDAAVAIVIPPGFERDVLRGTPAHVQAILDGSDSNRANVAAGTVTTYFNTVNQATLRARADQFAATRGTAASIPRVTVESRVLFNPQLETAIYMVPGVAAILLLLITTIVAAMGLSRERETGTLEQILVTPVPASVLIAGKVLPFAVIGLIDFAIALVVGNVVFEMPLRGSMLLLFGTTLLYLLVTLGIGLLISTNSGSQQQAFLGGFFFLLPAALLSGIMTPVRSMPSWLQVVTEANPLRHYAEVLRGSLIRGAGFDELFVPILVLAAMGTVIFTYASIQFRAATMK